VGPNLSINSIDEVIANHYHFVIDTADPLAMQTALTSFSLLNHPSSDRAGGQGVAPSEKPVPLVESKALLQGNKTVGILHNGSLYRLQATKLGKLILTK
jgi:hemin uptake protein HemP